MIADFAQRDWIGSIGMRTVFGMEILEEEFGGTMVMLEPGDRLKSVPRSHRKLITAEIEQWWADPIRAMRVVADSAIVPNMGQWFRRMADAGTWSLQLHQSFSGSMQAGYCWSCPDIRGAEVGPPPLKPVVNHLPRELAAYYRLVGFVDWNGFGASGGLCGLDDCIGIDPSPSRLFVFGWSPDGNMLVFHVEGQGGWYDQENGGIRSMGSVADAINWVYGELLADRCPNC